MSQPLHIGCRPTKLGEVAGNKPAIKMLNNILNRNLVDIPHAWLFTGPYGTGKTTLASISADLLGCSETDCHAFNSANMRGIETIRNIVATASLAPAIGDVKVYIFDEVHMWTKDAKEAALKLLENPPENVFFFLVTTNPERLSKGILSRCTNVVTKLLTNMELNKLLTDICISEKIDLTEIILEEIVNMSAGCARDAVKLLDQVYTLEDEDDMLDIIENFSSVDMDHKDLCKALLNHASWEEIGEILNGIPTHKAESTRFGVLNYVGPIHIRTGDPYMAHILEEFKHNYFDSGKVGLQLSCHASLQFEEE